MSTPTNDTREPNPAAPCALCAEPYNSHLNGTVAGYPPHACPTVCATTTGRLSEGLFSRHDGFAAAVVERRHPLLSAVERARESTRCQVSTAELSALSDDELRVKVAAACGWKRITTDGFFIGESPNGGGFQGLPNYPSSLDACSSFERTMNDAQWNSYAPALGALCRVNVHHFNGSIIVARALITASPRERCIAFLSIHPEHQ